MSQGQVLHQTHASANADNRIDLIQGYLWFQCCWTQHDGTIAAGVRVLSCLSQAGTVICRRLKRVRDQQRSRFQSHDVLHSRYLLMNLLGKGGFSEVYKVKAAHSVVHIVPLLSFTHDFVVHIPS